jgi:Ubiquitin-activating enzyme active site
MHLTRHYSTPHLIYSNSSFFVFACVSHPRSRRRPSPLLFDPSDPTHRSFVLWAAVVRGRACGQTDLRSPADPRLTSAFEELASADISSGSSGSSGVSEEEVADLLIAAGSANRAELLSALSPEDFEKDDAELGHVDFATAAANLRYEIH